MIYGRRIDGITVFFIALIAAELMLFAAQ